MINSLAKFGFLLILSTVFVTISFGQTRSCNLQLTVETFIEGSYSKTVEVKDVKATLLHVNTKKVIKPSVKNGISFFPDQKDGNYEITIKKNGYETTNEVFRLDCYFAKNGVYLKEIVISRGDTKNIVEIQTKTTIDSSGCRVSTLEESLSELFPDAVLVGIVNDKAVNLVKPEYPEVAKAVKDQGEVSVQIVIDENGKVVWAKGLTGHPLLRAEAEKAAKESTFSPTILEGKAVKVTGIINYNFVP